METEVIKHGMEKNKIRFQKDLIVWKLFSAPAIAHPRRIVSEGLNSVETVMPFSIQV